MACASRASLRVVSLSSALRHAAQEAMSKVKGAAGAAVDSAKEGLASAYEGAKGLFAGLSGSKPMDAGAQASEL